MLEHCLKQLLSSISSTVYLVWSTTLWWRNDLVLLVLQGSGSLGFLCRSGKVQT